MTRSTLFLLGFMLCFSGACKQNRIMGDLSAGEPMIKMQKTSCRGRCPIYTIEIYENGQALFLGKQYIERIGSYGKVLKKKEIKGLRQRFLQSNFFDLDSEYLSTARDLPTTYLTFKWKDRSKRILDYYGAPQVLKDLEALIEEIVHREDWQPIEDIDI